MAIKIIGLKQSMKSEHFIYAGLFGMAINARIENVGMENNQILAENTSLSSGSSDVYAGGIVGYGHNITITNSYHTGTVTANSMFKGYAGGLIGYVRSRDLKVSGTIQNVEEAWLLLLQGN
ncbi:MAG: GLUG motif-containing protein [Bacillota bacterium]